MCAEHRFLVVGTERVESLQFIEELRRDIFKIYFGIDIDHCAGLFRQYMFRHETFESLGECLYVFHFHR